VRVWDAATGELLLTATGHHGWVESVGFSPDSARLVSGGNDGAVRVWDAATGELLLTATGHQGSVESVGFSPDSARLVSGGNDGAVRVWDAATGEPTAWRIDHLPDDELARWDIRSGRLSGASAGAWRWLGWVGSIGGHAVRMPAETFGPLPTL
jgi:WD40 repeat protein